MQEKDKIASRLKELGVDVPIEEIETRLNLLRDYRVPPAEARRSVLNYFLKEHGVTPQRSAGSELVRIADISDAGRWVDLETRVLELQEPTSPSISQTGTLGDGTGSIRFVKWAKAGLPDLVEGQSYHLKNVVTDQYQGRFSVKLNRSSEIRLLEQPIEAVTSMPSGAVTVSDINQSGRWVDLKTKVVQLWDSNNEAISQSGLIGDDTGVIKFVKWTKAGLPDLVEGKSYLFKNLITDEFQGRFSVKLNRTTEITEIDEAIEVGSQTITFMGALVDVQKGSGLIKRCPLCKRSLAKGVCPDHGKVEGIYDLRVKAAMDDGLWVQDVLLNRERTEEILDLTLEEAKAMAMEALDHEIIMGLIEEKMVGRYFRATGPRVDRYLLVETIERLPGITPDEIEELISLAEVA